MTKIDHSSITMKQLFFSVTCFIQSSALLTTFFTSVSHQDSWAAVIFGVLFTIPVFFVLSQLMKMYPDKTLLGICCEVCGKTVGKMLSVLYLIFFLLLASLNLGDFGYFVQNAMMPNTPTLLVVTGFVFVCAQAVKGGAQVICRYALLFTLIALMILAVGTLLSLPLWHVENFLPVFNLPIMKYVQSSHLVTTLPLAETTLFLMLTPSVSGDKTKLTRYLIFALLLGAINLLVVVIRNSAVLGNTMHLLAMPPFEVFRLINASSALSRMEILFAVGFIMLFFFKNCLFFYAAATAFAETFGLKSYKSIVYLMGGLIVAMSFNGYQSNIDHADSARRFTAFQFMIPEIIIPVMLMIGGKIKQNKKQKQATSPEPSGQPTEAATSATSGKEAEPAQP